ncbi:MAG: rRNA maturation RNase YbeY [Pseudomonadota bacterium]
MQIDTIIEAPEWDTLDLAARADVAGAALAAHLSLPAEAEVTLMGTDDARIAALNADFRGKPAPTNVLSWPSAARAPGGTPQPDAFGDLHLGDIAIAYQTCAREAAQHGKPLDHHVTHLIVHGLLHLLGHDHEIGSEATIMEQIEREVLGKMGIPDPY